MKQELLFTAGQFAALHHLNKRTLHYYDMIGLFAPARKGENGYRYYTYGQSVELENILALRELGMSIEEIKAYLKRPNPHDFMQIVRQESAEIDRQIRRLQNLKALLGEKAGALALCADAWDGKIEVVPQGKAFLLLTPLHAPDADPGNTRQIMEHLQAAWQYNTHKTGCGSYISSDKIQRGVFDDYDGLFTPIKAAKKQDCFHLRPAGDYLCGYCIGDWGKIPRLYEKMLRFAREKGLALTGYCYERGLNEFAIAGVQDYVTQILVQCHPKTMP